MKIQSIQTYTSSQKNNLKETHFGWGGFPELSNGGCKGQNDLAEGIVELCGAGIKKLGKALGKGLKKAGESLEKVTTDKK